MSTVLHQLDTPGKGIFGMSYVVQTDDGSTVVVDGGFNKDDAEYLFEYLKKVTGREKPVVDAWFITHNHADHTYCFMSMADNHAADIEVKKVVFCFLSDEFYKNCQEATVAERHRFADCIEKLGSQIIEPVPGDVFNFGSARIEILYTARQLPVVDGGRGNELNDTSLVFRLYAEGQSVLFLGDVQKAADDVMIALYGKSLKSDVVQLAHHGEFSSTAEFYSYVDPDIVLWPMDMKGIDGRLYSMITSSDANRTLLCDLHVKDVFIAGFGTVRFELPIKPCVAPFWTGDVDSLRSCIPSYTMVYLEGMPSDLDDPLWEKAGKVKLDFCKKAATPVYADLR
ncbi:MAG: MBL fold metallo-hydrolase, partial [Clostridia bacterium]|nr:MBL fold metallo-hydrolase [Clostridia bacterium]